MLKTFKILISGQVQGVGFRPFVYTLAQKHELKGTVSNNEEGVIIYISGNTSAIQKFYKQLIQNPPPVSNIQSSVILETKAEVFNNFKIVPSNKKGSLNLPLTPDFAICEVCKTEIKDSNNRRHNYPFTTCVNCGPRWAITQTFPFERAHTTIHNFPMCTTCEEEYTNPSNRRFHSQTNTCNTCGIALFLVNDNGEKLVIKKNNLFKKVSEFLKQGKCIAIKNTSGYLLCCNAEDSAAVKRLRINKNRPHKPFAVLYPSLPFLQNEIELSKHQIQSLQSTQSPINIVSLNNYKGKIALQDVAPGLNQLGVMLPYSGILQLLVNELNFPIVATSGNLHGSPIISKNEDAIEKLKYVADYFLQHNLKITHPQDDSVVKFSNKFQQQVLFRRSRGFAPNYFNAPIKTPQKILALGAHLKSCIAFYPNQYLYLSQYLGNLDNYDVYNRFVATTQGFLTIFEQQPNVILIDKHKGYHSTAYGKELHAKFRNELVEIQHHKAHFAAILGEFNLFNKKVLGVVFDGTGYGDDGAIWGGEFFNYEKNTITRINHLSYFNWLLSDKMSKEPRLSLLSFINDDMLPAVADKFTESELKTYLTLKRTNLLKTSSMGRLFDAVASLLNITDINTYEGEAAILLENKISTYNLKTCVSYVSNDNFDGQLIISGVYNDVLKGMETVQIVQNFLFTIASFIIKMAADKNYKCVAFSGGVFQNTTLVDILLELAPKELKLYFHKALSPNDENISFGQLMYYLHIKKNKMKYLEEYRNFDATKKYLDEIHKITTHQWNIMEICGGQTHSLVKNGILELLPEKVRMIHGPGCPVCVTPLNLIDKAIELLENGVIVCSFGDMIRVPGSKKSLLEAKADGGDLRVLYSPIEAVTIAKENPDKEVVFFAVGFETTAPANALSVLHAEKEGLNNYAILASHVLVPPAMEAILADEFCSIDAFLAAGHVCAIMGIQEYYPLVEKYKVPIVVTGFEPLDLVQGIYMAVRQLEEGRCTLENQYSRAVKEHGNKSAKAVIQKVFEVGAREWRGIGEIPNSGYVITPAYKKYDAEAKYKISNIKVPENADCIAGQILKGIKKPNECSQFGKVCKPSNPLGAPMVSSEGACAAYYHFSNTVNN